MKATFILVMGLKIKNLDQNVYAQSPKKGLKAIEIYRQVDSSVFEFDTEQKTNVLSSKISYATEKLTIP
jgi:hypothetical protein